MNSTLIKTQIQIMAAQATLLAEGVSDWRTSIYWQGKVKGFNALVDANAEMICQFRDKTQDAAFKERSLEGNSYEYHFLEGVAAAARESLTLHYLCSMQGVTLG
jgi:hypothetical protein